MQEIFFFVVEVFCNVLFELLVNVFAESFGGVNFGTSGEGIDSRKIFNFVIYASCGILAGFFSVWLFPHKLIRNQTFQIFGLIVNPLICGFALYWFKRRNGAAQRSFGNFINGWTCVFLTALIQFVLTK